jgi:lipoprotein-anchoring transpeptidase ErfK/SrfK
MYRRARRRNLRRTLGFAAAAVVVGGAIWILWPGPRPETGPDTGAEPGTVAAATPESASTPSPATPPLARPEAGITSTRPATTTRPSASTSSDSGITRPTSPERPASEPAPAPAPAPATAPTPGPAVRSSADVLAQLDGAMEDLDRHPLSAREELSRLLLEGELAPADAALVRDALTALNQQLVFGMRFIDGDPFVESYRIQSGDALSRLPGRRGWRVGWRLIADISGIPDPARLQVGQTVKGLRGPFHAVVTKRSYRMDIWMGDLSAAPVYVRSFNVGLGSDDRTPVGRWEVLSKDVNPSWRNPETGESFSRDDPENPIGERWIGIRGIDPANRDMLGFGIHGTIDDDSIGRDESMGCVRLRHDDIVQLYDLLQQDSLIVIRTREDDPLGLRR